MSRRDPRLPHDADGPMKVLVVDDHPVVRTGLSALLAAHGEFAVVGEAGNGEEAVRQAARLRPDLVLMDIQMGGWFDGLEATRRIVAMPDAPKVLVLTTYDSEADILRAMDAGVHGYLPQGVASRRAVRRSAHRRGRGDGLVATCRLPLRRAFPQPWTGPQSA